MNAVIDQRNTMPVEQTQATSLLQVIERAARDSSVDIDKMERLMQMHERIVAREAKAAYADALANMQPDLPMIAERGGIKDKNGQVQSKYALWEDIVAVITPILSKHGFALSFRTGNVDNMVLVRGVLSHRLGHSEETEMRLPIDSSGSKNSVQAVGSSTAYGKRYTASALLNLRSGGEDDDGKSGGGGFITEKQATDLQALAEEVKANREQFLKYFDITCLADLPAAKYKDAVAALEAKRNRPTRKQP